MVYIFFDKKSTIANTHTITAIVSDAVPIINNQLKNYISQLLKNYCQKTYKKYVHHLKAIFGVQILQIYNLKINTIKEVDLAVIGIFGKYGLVVLLKDKRVITITNEFQKLLDESDRKPNKIWVNKVSEFYQKLMKSRLGGSNIDIHSTLNENMWFVAKRFIRTLKNKIYKYVTATSKNVHIDKLDDLVNEYKNTYHRTIKMKPIDVENNVADPKFKVGCQNIRMYVSCTEEVFVIRKVKKTVRGYM